MTSSGNTVVGKSSVAIALLVVHRGMVCIVIEYAVASIGICRALEKRHCYGRERMRVRVTGGLKFENDRGRKESPKEKEACQANNADVC
jgi:hypothetical protein